MKRSGGVTASAILALVGSAVCILFGLLTVVTAATMRNQPTPVVPNMPASPISPGVSLAIAALFYLAFGGWGVASGIGLLRQRPWARICFVVFGVLLAVGSLFAAMGLLITARVLPQTLPQTMPPGTSLPPGFLSAFLVVMAVIALFCLVLGVVWAVFFNRRTVKHQFEADGADGAEGTDRTGNEVAMLPRKFPISITLIAWLMIASGVFAIPNLVQGFPLMLFGFVFHGWGARGFSILIAAVNLAAGTGLLRKRIEAHALAVGIYGFYLVNMLITVVIPGSAQRLQAYLAEIQPGQPVPAMMEEIFPVAMVTGSLAIAVLLWFLITRRQAYIAACNEQIQLQANPRD